jgi:hypothetical protein
MSAVETEASNLKENIGKLGTDLNKRVDALDERGHEERTAIFNRIRETENEVMKSRGIWIAVFVFGGMLGGVAAQVLGAVIVGMFK